MLVVFKQLIITEYTCHTLVLHLLETILNRMIIKECRVGILKLLVI